MNNEQRAQAKELYFKTDLTKTQIAELVGVSRRSLHYWVSQNNWDRLKKNADTMPSFIAENCYQVLSHLTGSLLDESRVTMPVTPQEANTIYKLTLTIGKLKKRAAVNESMETLCWFTDSVQNKDPEFAKQLQPFIDEYLASRVAVDPRKYLHTKIDEYGYLSQSMHEKKREAELDEDDVCAWAEEKNAVKQAQVKVWQDNFKLTPDEQKQADRTSVMYETERLLKLTDEKNAEIAQPATPSPQPPAPAQPPTVAVKPPKVDLRKQFRFTASSGPGKSMREKLAKEKVA